jgi:hypothetical protein
MWRRSLAVHCVCAVGGTRSTPAREGDPDFVNDTLLARWNATALIPASCTDCTNNGHITRLVEWELAADDNFTMSALRSEV